MIFEGQYINGDKNGKAKEYRYITEDSVKKVYKYEVEYLKGKKNGEAKIYINNRLFFEGKYTNGKINGKVKLFNNNKKIYEGQFLNNYKDGLGKEYFENGNISFQGEYINERRWNGKGYNMEGKEVFEIKNGRGFGTIYNSDGTKNFKGHFINGKKVGPGKEYFNDTIIFDGHYTND